MVTVGDIVALIGRVRAIDGDNALVVLGANGNHALRAEDAELLKASNIAQLNKTTTQSFAGLVQFLGSAAPQSNTAATAGVELVRKNEFDADQWAQNLYLLGVLAGYQPLDSDLTAIAALATTSFGRALLTEASATTLRETIAVPRTIQFHATSGSSITLTSLPEAERFINGSAPQAIRAGDLTGCLEVRLWAYIATNSAAGPDPRLLVSWYDAFSTTHTDYVDLGDGAEVEVSVAATGLVNSGWVSIDRSACIDPCYVALKSAGGDGSGNPAFRAAWLEYR